MDLIESVRILQVELFRQGHLLKMFQDLAGRDDLRRRFCYRSQKSHEKDNGGDLSVFVPTMPKRMQ